tara:strand:- start:69 stop:200 length:132 start_codon:yes stop_codon:yes gene_type:complete
MDIFFCPFLDFPEKFLQKIVFFDFRALCFGFKNKKNRTLLKKK